MFIALDGLFSGNIDSVGIDCTFDFSSEKINGEFPFTSPVAVEGEITNRAGLVEINADASFSYTAMCGRCCEQATIDYVFPICHCLVQSLNGEDAGDDYIVCEDMQLKLDTLIYEDILLSLPPVHLCKDDCKGLCPSCGVNLNKEKCECKKPVDPRLESLLSLMDDE